MAEMDDGVISADDLEVGESVGSGRTCEVFRGKFKGQLVAIKQNMARGPALSAVRELREFSRELTILKQLSTLRHPHLVHFIGCTRGNPMRIINEFCGGGTVYDLLHCSDHMELTWAMRVAMSSQVADAMAYLHGATPRVMHRDLKSHNLLLANPVYDQSDIPRVKVADFGLARMIWPDNPAQDLTTDIGTYHWKAPEMMRGADYNEKVDVYSYAIVLFEICCRSLPFEDQDLHPNQYIRAITSGQRPDLDDCLEDECPDTLREIILEGWDQDPDRRPAFTQVMTSLAALSPAPPADQ